MTPSDLREKWDYNTDEAFHYLKYTRKIGAWESKFDLVRDIVFESAGDNDGPDWVAVGHLTDGQAFILVAGCNYTGWDCQASGWSNVGPTLGDVLHPWCIPDDIRDRLRGHLDFVETSDAPPAEGTMQYSSSWDMARSPYLGLAGEI